MKITKSQLEALSTAPGPNRYAHFIKLVADWEEVWGLYQDGWALAATDDGEEVFPLWPAKEYAQLCAKDGWSDYIPKSIPLRDFIDDLLPEIRRRNVRPCIFYTAYDQGVVPEFDELLGDLRIEMDKY